MDSEQVLNMYRAADENRRLSLFLGFRDLRDQFELIEQESQHEDFIIVMPWTRRLRKHDHRLAHA